MIPSLTLGVEEEYLLVDPDTRDLVVEPPPEFMDQCREALGERVTPEFLRCQVEIGTPVCANIGEFPFRLGLELKMRAFISRLDSECIVLPAKI